MKMKMLHRITKSGDGVAWCGQPYSGNHSAQHDAATLPLNLKIWLSLFKICEACTDLYGDVLSQGSGSPILVHNHSGWPKQCGSQVRGEWTRVITEEALAGFAGLYTRKLVPCRRCLAVQPAAPAKKVDDGFNGDCPRCGMRTYMGATPAAFEHQGGPCPKTR